MGHSVPQSIAILGAGLTGLTAAHRLTQRGHRVRLFEQSGRVGGAIRTENTGGWLIEAGPNTIVTGEPALAALLHELGLAGACVTASPTAKHRYIVRRGRPIAAPLSLPSFLGSSLLSPIAKVRLLVELVSGRRVRTADLSLEEFIRSHFGQEVVNYALNPFVSGIYAGNPQKLSTRYAFPKLWELEKAHGSLLRGLFATAKARRARGEPKPGIISFAQGLQTLPLALAARLPAGTLTLHARLEGLVPGAKWNVIWHDGQAAQTETFDAVIAALPAPALASLRLGPLAERPLAGLDAIEHPPVTSLFLGYRFPGRAPDGHVALTVMVGGTRQPEIASLPPERLLAHIRSDLVELLGVTGDPVFSRHTFWPRAIPQYNLGHPERLAQIDAALEQHPGLALAGNAYRGIGIPDCIHSGQLAAEKVA